MAIFCVKDGDTSGSDGFNAPLKKVEKRVAPAVTPRYTKTSTPGVVIDNCTGKMETQLPLPAEIPVPRSRSLTSPGATALANKIFSDYLEGMKAKESGQTWLDWARGK